MKKHEAGEWLMSETQWQIKGDYFEACNCAFVCPCAVSSLQVSPTTDDQTCTVTFLFHIEDGTFGDLSLVGLDFVMVAYAPGPTMAAGNWQVGLILDPSTTEAQRDALTAIASGQAGGAMAALSGLIGEFKGVEIGEIRFKKDGLRYTLDVPGLVAHDIEGLSSPVEEGQPVTVSPVFHPANSTLGLARAKKTSVSVFGFDLQIPNGGNNAHFAPFNWSN